MKYFQQSGYFKAVIKIETTLSTRNFQAQMLKGELSELNQKSKNYSDKELYALCDNISHNGNAFAFIFNEKVLELEPRHQRRLVTSLYRFISTSKVINAFDSLEYITSLDANESISAIWLRKYTEALYFLGYSLSLQAMLNALSKVFSKEDIEAEYLVQKLKHSDFCLA